VRKKKFSLLFILLLVLSLIVVGCGSKEPAEPEEPLTEENNMEEGQATEEEPKAGGSIILSTTTSTENSGLLDFILPDFTEKTGIEVKVVAVGTGKALQMGVDGEADVLLVHAKASEEEFVAEGHGLERFDVMYNDYILVGPADDPAKIKDQANSNIVDAFKLLHEGGHTFVSRGDDSGTHKKELELWGEAGLEPEGAWYVSAGKGMGDVLQMADEMQGYTLADRATYLSMRDNLELVIVTEGDERLFNQYGVIAVNPEKNDQINAEGAQAFIAWLLSDETQELISQFGVAEYGEPLFIPNAK